MIQTSSKEVKRYMVGYLTKNGPRFVYPKSGLIIDAINFARSIKYPCWIERTNKPALKTTKSNLSEQDSPFRFWLKDFLTH